MNMLLHDVNYKNFDIRNNDTLEHPEHEGMKFEAIVANPPYSAKWSGDAKFLDDERFSAYGKLAPKSKADFAFIQHMIHHLNRSQRNSGSCITSLESFLGEQVKE